MTESESFWRARESWIAGHRTAQAAASRAGVSIPLDRKTAQWSSRGGFYLRKTGLSSEIVTVDPALQVDILRTIERLAPKLAAAMDAHLGPLAREVFDGWPVESGLSKSLINLEYYVEGDHFVGAIESRAPYTVFIREAAKKDADDPEAVKRRERVRAIRAAAIAAGKEASLISNRQGTTSTGNRSGGKQVYKVLIADRGRATAEAIAADALASIGVTDGQ